MKPSIQLEVHNGNGTPQTHPEPIHHIDPTKNEKNSRFKSDMEKANIFSFVYFTYSWRLMKNAFIAARNAKMINVLLIEEIKIDILRIGKKLDHFFSRFRIKSATHNFPVKTLQRKAF